MENELGFIQSLLSDEFVDEGFPLIYKGEFNHQIMKLFTSMAENKIMKSKKEDAVRKKVFHVMVECLQNITKHSEKTDEEGKKIGYGMCVIGEKTEYYFVVTGNKIKNEDVESLRLKLDDLNGKSKDELTEMHKKQMKEGRLSDKEGAGLGLIDILRKTGQKIIYEFIPLDSHNQYFIMEVRVVN
jgi:hypothetical protein